MELIYASGMAAKLRSQWDRDEGLGQNHNAVKFLGQDYESLRSRCLQSRGVFEDTQFPCTPSSLGFNELGPRSSKTQGVRWKRPSVRGVKGGVRGVTVGPGLETRLHHHLPDLASSPHPSPSPYTR